MMHYGCASFEIFWILATIIFERVFTFPPRRWFAPLIDLPLEAYTDLPQAYTDLPRLVVKFL